MRNGINLGDPVTFQRVVKHLIATIGEKWLGTRLAALSGGQNAPLPWDDGSRLLTALSDYPAMLRALEGGLSPRDPHLMLHLAMVAWVVSECSVRPGGARFNKKLRRLARADRWSAFFDTLFEGEAALYWRDEMRATRVEFPTGSHPDFLATADLYGREFSIPNECKRIEPVERRESDLDGFAALLEPKLRAWVNDHAPIKVVVWLHDEATRISDTDVLQLISELATKALLPSCAGRWLAASDSEGLFQVSVADAGEAGELRERSIAIKDVPAVGPLFVRTKGVYLGKPQDPVSLAYVLSVRSDVLPNRIGALERNRPTAATPEDTSVPATRDR